MSQGDMMGGAAGGGDAADYSAYVYYDAELE